MSGFNAGLRGLANLGIPMATVVKKETGELIKEVSKKSPAADKKRIADDILRKFEWQAIEVNSHLAGQGKMSKSGIEWVGVNSHYLTGIAPNLDQRNATVDELKKLSYSITKKGRIRKDFKHPRSQRVLLLQTVLTKLKTVKALATAKSKNRGRLKASWLTAVRDGVIQLSGGNIPPAWVNKHADMKAAGRHLDETRTPNAPAFTIASHAKGVNSGNQRSLIQQAIRTRAAKMAGNVKQYFAGKKNLADYAQ